MMNNGGNSAYGSVAENSYASVNSTSSIENVCGPQTTDIFRILQSVITMAFLITVLVIGVVLVLKTETKDTLEDLRDIIVVTRHGERQPLIQIEGMGDYTPGDLTPFGEKQMTMLGQRLAQQYRKILRRITHSKAFAMNGSRFINSANAMMKGINVPYDINYIPALVINSSDPDYDNFIKYEKQFRQAVPACTKEAAMTIISKMNISLPEEQTLLFGILIADSLDMARSKGFVLPYGLDNLECLKNDSSFLSPKLYQALADLMFATFGKPALRILLTEMKRLREMDKPAFSTVFISDAHMTGLLGLLDSTKGKQPRPGYGASLVFQFFLNDVEVLYSPKFDEATTTWMNRENIEEFLERMQHSIG